VGQRTTSLGGYSAAEVGRALTISRVNAGRCAKRGKKALLCRLPRPPRAIHGSDSEAYFTGVAPEDGTGARPVAPADGTGACPVAPEDGIGVKPFSPDIMQGNFLNDEH
jgi:hypothetical protein